jgi:hypothetical protein
MGLTRREALRFLAAPLLAGDGGFVDRLQPAPVGGGFAMDDWWVWCGSAIRGEDGRYHLFASRWPKSLSFSPHWLTNSEIVRASADKPTGPYRFEEVVLPTRGEKWWDGRMTHNPTIHRWRDQYLLFYIGTTYSGPTPDAAHPVDNKNPARLESRANQRIGLATSRSVKGPWKRMDRPILDPRPGKWDALMTTNPAPCVNPDGSVLLVYKSAVDQAGLLTMGVARAPRFDRPYERLKDGPLFDFSSTRDHVEDAYVWREGSGYQLIMKDMRGGICGEAGAGIHATSANGVDWTVSKPAKAWSLNVRWSDGVVRQHRNVERPQLLIENGRPTHAFFATSTGPRGGRPEKSWSMAIPLA